MNNIQIQMLFEWVKIPFGLVQFKPVFDAKGCNQTIHRFTDGDADIAELLEISGASDHKLGIKHAGLFEFRQGAECSLEFLVAKEP
jgi:hypothetical protein